METPPTRYQGRIKKIDPRDNYNRFGIEQPGQNKWLWVSFFGNLAPNSVGASIDYELCTDSKGRPYISEYAILEQGTGANPPLGYNGNGGNGASHRPPQGHQPPPPAQQPEQPQPRPREPSNNEMLELTLTVARYVFESGEVPPEEGFKRAVAIACDLDTALKDYRRGRRPGAQKSLENAPPSNPAAFAQELEKRHMGDSGASEEDPEPDPVSADEPLDDIPF